MFICGKKHIITKVSHPYTATSTPLLTMQGKLLSSCFKRNLYFPGAAGPGPELGHVKREGVTQFTNQS
jgi:hypothetical protein